MKTVLIGAMLVLAMAGVAEAREPLGATSKYSTKALVLGGISVKQLPPAKIWQGWVLHNPYKPQSAKLTVLY